MRGSEATGRENFFLAISIEFALCNILLYTYVGTVYSEIIIWIRKHSYIASLAFYPFLDSVGDKATELLKKKRSVHFIILKCQRQKKVAHKINPISVDIKFWEPLRNHQGVEGDQGGDHLPRLELIHFKSLPSKTPYNVGNRSYFQ